MQVNSKKKWSLSNYKILKIKVGTFYFDVLLLQLIFQNIIKI